MKTPSLILLMAGFALSPAHAQVSPEWVARYASPTSWADVPYAMTVDAAGHAYVTGTVATSGSNDWATIKYDAAGGQVWLRQLNGGGNDAAFAIQTDPAGNVYLTGSSAGGFYSMTAKYGPDGTPLWVQSFTTIGEGDAGVDLAVDDAGNVYVTGYNVETATGLDIITIKYSPAGAELWVRRYDAANGEDVPAAIACDASGIYVAGRSGADFTILKYDTGGNVLWVRNYDSGGSDSPAAMALDAAGNLIVTGQSDGQGTNADFATLKYDPAGTLLWARRYDGPTTVLVRDYDRPAALAIDADGNVFVAGNSTDDYGVVKYDAAGTEQWVRRYDNAGADWATALAVDASGNAYVTGSSYGNTTTQYDFATLSYDPSGALRWTERYDGPGHSYDTGRAIAVHASGNVVVTGSSGGSDTGLDYTTIQYAPETVGVAPAAGTSFALRGDPNPFTPATRIRFTIPGEGGEHVRLAVYDVSGRQVALLADEALAAGPHERTLEGRGLAPGVYWSRLTVGTREETKRLVRVR
jgi:uncharacterized delta-60 repeat protein